MKTRARIALVLETGLVAAVVLLVAACGTVETITARDATGRLGFDVSPAGVDAVVTIDGQRAGPASSFDGKHRVLEVTAGTHEVLIEAPGYEPFLTRVYMSDQTQVLRVVLKPR